MMKRTLVALLAMLPVLGCASAGSMGTLDSGVMPPAARKEAAEADRAEPSRMAASASPVALAHVIHDGGLRVVLEPSPDDGWTAGAARLLSKGSPIVVRRDVNMTRIPATLAAAVGRRVQLMRAGDRVCEATITGLALIGRVEPYFGMRTEWQGSEDPPRAPLSDDEIADEAWKLSDTGGHALAAELGGLTGEGCAAATWARDAAAPVPSVAKAVPASPSRSRIALEELRKLSSYAEIQGAFDAAEPLLRGTPWETAAGTELVVSEMSLGRGDRTWVWVSARSNEGCGAFFGELSALWEVRGGGALGGDFALRYEERAAPGSEPEAAVNVGAVGAGPIEVLFTGARLRESFSRYQLDTLSVPFLDCPC